MKKSTGIVFLLAVALAALAYFYDWKRHPSVDVREDPNKVTMAFTLKSEDITQVTLTRMGMTLVFDLKNDGWYISQPIAIRADQTAVDDILRGLATLPEDRTVPATPDQLGNYGLTNPAQVLEFKLKNGTTHKLRLGGKDFSGLEVYSQVDDDKNVALVSNIIVPSVDKSLDDFRDHTVAFLALNQVTSFDLHNQSGDISVKKDGEGWQIVKPQAVPGDYRATSSVLETVLETKVAKFVTDNPKDISPSVLAKYGLDNPSIRLRVTQTGGKTSELLLGKKEGIEYYAMDTSRSMIFRVPDSIYGKLNQTFLDLHARVLFTGQDSDLARVEVRGQSGTTVCSRDEAGGLVLEPDPAQKSSGPTSPIPCPDFLAPLERARASKLYDQPSAELKEKLAKPAVVVSLTGQAEQGSKKTEIQISNVSGNSVYGRTGNSPTVYEFDKNAFDALTSKPTATPK